MYWYNTNNYSVGFAPNSSINLYQADVSYFGDPYRLRWHLDLGVGGYRLGALYGLNDDTTYRKIVLAAPASVPTLGIGRAVYLNFTNLWIGSQYQVQASPDMVTWTNSGAPFTATNAHWRSTDYWVTDNSGPLYFRVVKP